MALLLRRLRHRFSREASSHPAPVPASRIDPDGALLPPALCQRRFDIRTSERSTVLTFCSHFQLSRVFGRRGGEQSRRQLVMMPVGELPSGLGSEHPGLSPGTRRFGKDSSSWGDVRRCNPKSQCHRPSWWEGTSRSPLAVLGLGKIAAPGYAPTPCREIISFGGKKKTPQPCKNGIEESFPQEGTSRKRNCLKIQGNRTPKHPTVLSTRETLSIWGK